MPQHRRINQSTALRATSSLSSNTCRDGASVTSLGRKHTWHCGQAAELRFPGGPPSQSRRAFRIRRDTATSQMVKAKGLPGHFPTCLVRLKRSVSIPFTRHGTPPFAETRSPHNPLPVLPPSPDRPCRQRGAPAPRDRRGRAGTPGSAPAPHRGRARGGLAHRPRLGAPGPAVRGSHQHEEEGGEGRQRQRGCGQGQGQGWERRQRHRRRQPRGPSAPRQRRDSGRAARRVRLGAAGAPRRSGLGSAAAPLPPLWPPLPPVRPRRLPGGRAARGRHIRGGRGTAMAAAFK